VDFGKLYYYVRIRTLRNHLKIDLSPVREFTVKLLDHFFRRARDGQKATESRNAAYSLGDSG
jgi:hypothetical protein